MEDGEIEIDSILLISFADNITPELARESGFKGVVDLLKVAKHGPGENVYLVRFHFISPTTAAAVGRPRVRGVLSTRGRQGRGPEGPGGPR